MFLSCLLRNPCYAERLQKFSPVQQADSVQVPSITRLQSAIEEAWGQGFDLQVNRRTTSSTINKTNGIL